MKKYIISIICFLIFSVSGFAQNKDVQLSPKDVIDKYFKALGGKEKLESVQSTIIESTIRAEGLEASLYSVKLGNKFKSIQKVMGKELVQLFDGEKGYNIDMRGIKLAIPLDKIKELKKGKTIDELNYDPANFEAVTSEEIDGKKYNILTSEKGRFYFNNDTGLLYKSVVDGGAVLIKDYMTVDGIKFQSDVEIDSNKENGKKVSIKTNKVTVNKGITDETFK